MGSRGSCQALPAIIWIISPIGFNRQPTISLPKCDHAYAFGHQTLSPQFSASLSVLEFSLRNSHFVVSPGASRVGVSRRQRQNYTFSLQMLTNLSVAVMIHLTPGYEKHTLEISRCCVSFVRASPGFLSASSSASLCCSLGSASASASQRSR